MKNLPDKIYLATTEEIQNLDSSFVGIAHSNPENIIEPIEYIRKDAFIEKACEFLKDRVEHDSIDYPMATKYLVEDFKKYMEE